jgi:tetratricopeptide (TPR) repeat protein
MHLYEYPIDPRYYNPAIPAHIAQAILQALAKSSDQRHESVADFLHVLGLTETHIGRRTGLQKNKEQWLMEGYTEHKADHYNYALEAFNHAIRLDPHYADAYYGKGLVLFRQNDYRGALESFDMYIRSNPQSSKAYLRRGNALYCLKQYEEAIKAYNQAIRLNPSYALAFYNKGLAFECLGFRRKAILARKRARQLGFAK